LNTNHLIAAQTYKRENNFGLLRLILAFMVVSFHINMLYGVNPGRLISYLVGFAVSSFFVISGLLVTWSFDKDQELIAYSIKRFFRIYPLYFIMILIQMCALLALFPGVFNMKLAIYSLKYFVYNAIFLNFLQPTIPGVFENLKYNAINGSLWTIKIEVLFYVLLPLIYYAFKKFRIKFLILIYFLSALFFIVSTMNPAWNTFVDQFPAYLRFFIVGIILYLYGYKIRFSSFYALLISVILFFTSYYAIGNVFYKAFVYPVCLGIIVYLVGFSKPVFDLKYDISYGVYIIHFPVIQIFLFFGYFTSSFYLFIPVVLTVIILMASLSYILVEKRFIELGHRLPKKLIGL
jgi:peptidoglycan/LPS O-acetylase OafA/YrhL